MHSLLHPHLPPQIYKRDEAFNTNEIANGVLACLVAVTGCCPFIDPLWALLIGGTCMWSTQAGH